MSLSLNSLQALHTSLNDAKSVLFKRGRKVLLGNSRYTINQIITKFLSLSKVAPRSNESFDLARKIAIQIDKLIQDKTYLQGLKGCQLTELKLRQAFGNLGMRIKYGADYRETSSLLRISSKLIAASKVNPPPKEEIPLDQTPKKQEVPPPAEIEKPPVEQVPEKEELKPPAVQPQPEIDAAFNEVLFNLGDMIVITNRLIHLGMAPPDFGDFSATLQQKLTNMTPPNEQNLEKWEALFEFIKDQLEKLASFLLEEHQALNTEYKILFNKSENLLIYLRDTFLKFNRQEEALEFNRKILNPISKDRFFADLAKKMFDQNDLEKALDLTQEITHDFATKDTLFASIVERHIQGDLPKAMFVCKLIAEDLTTRDRLFGKIAEEYLKQADLLNAKYAIDSIFNDNTLRDSLLKRIQANENQKRAKICENIDQFIQDYKKCALKNPEMNNYVDTLLDSFNKIKETSLNDNNGKTWADFIEFMEKDLANAKPQDPDWILIKIAFQMIVFSLRDYYLYHLFNDKIVLNLNRKITEFPRSKDECFAILAKKKIDQGKFAEAYVICKEMAFDRKGKDKLLAVIAEKLIGTHDLLGAFNVCQLIAEAATRDPLYIKLTESYIDKKDFIRATAPAQEIEEEETKKSLIKRIKELEKEAVDRNDLEQIVAKIVNLYLPQKEIKDFLLSGRISSQQAQEILNLHNSQNRGIFWCLTRRGLESIALGIFTPSEIDSMDDNKRSWCLASEDGFELIKKRIFTPDEFMGIENFKRQRIIDDKFIPLLLNGTITKEKALSMSLEELRDIIARP